MNIDFHYGVVYVVSRLAGLSQDQAEIVAHACQYVDDATTTGVLHFRDGETFERFASAHELVDYQNIHNDINRTVWVPFHFLPGGQGETIQAKAVCRPDSAIAREMMASAISANDKSNALHRIGVSLHVYVDTWAHQGFSGIVSPINRVDEMESHDLTPETWRDELARKAAHIVDATGTFILDHVAPLGHGAALHLPDQPWSVWHYNNGGGERISRDNPKDFAMAADMACRAVRGFLDRNPNFATCDGLTSDAAAGLAALLNANRDPNPAQRQAALSEAVARGEVPGINEAIPPYIAKGPGSWKQVATGLATLDDGPEDEQPEWSPRFENSDYRKFHDAIKEHRYVVVNEILPRHGVRLT